MSRVGAGALLSAVGLAEFWLSFASSAWWYRGGASAVVAVGVLLVARTSVQFEIRRINVLAQYVAQWRTAVARRVALVD